MTHCEYVSYGCGFCAPEGWVNFDASPTLRFEHLPVVGRLHTKNKQRFPSNVRYGDVVRGLPVAGESCKGVFASHVLEHLTLDEFHIALKQTFAMMAPGGVFRLIVPDLEKAAREYISGIEAGKCGAGSEFMEATSLGVKSRRTGLLGRLYESLSTSRHLWMWDRLSLGEALRSHGFVDVRECKFGDAEDPMFALVEDAGRFEGAVAMEARKPAR